VGIAESDEGSGILELGLLQEVLHFNGIIVVCLLNDSVNFGIVTHFGASFNVFEVNIRVLRVRKDVAEEEELSLVKPEAVEDLKAFLLFKFVCKSYSNLSDDLFVLSVYSEHLVHALE
jgi:hypothetical protein